MPGRQGQHRLGFRLRELRLAAEQTPGVGQQDGDLISQGLYARLSKPSDAPPGLAPNRRTSPFYIDDDGMVYAEAAKGWRYGGANQLIPIDACFSLNLAP
jgi:hypothetical protein